MVTVLLNPAAGGHASQNIAARVGDALEGAGVRARLVILDSAAHTHPAARSALADGAKTIVAAGGDGTVSAIASALAGSAVAFGVLPLGTLNHFAKDLNIPLVLEDAAKTIAAGHSIAVDVGEVNGRTFINNSSLGLYPHIVRHRETQQRRLGRGKWPALAWATLTLLRRSRVRVAHASAGHLPRPSRRCCVSRCLTICG